MMLLVPIAAKGRFAVGVSDHGVQIASVKGLHVDILIQERE